MNSPIPPSYTPRDENNNLALSKPSNAFESNVNDPVLQVTETIVTTTRTTIYSPRSPATISSPSRDQLRPSPASSTFPPNSNPSPSPSSLTIPSSPSPLPVQIHKDLPLLPPDDLRSTSLDVPALNHAPVTFPGSSHSDASSTAYLARAALRLGSPALGFAFDGSSAHTRPAARSETPGTPNSTSTFTLSSSPEPSPVLRQSMSYDEHGVLRSDGAAEPASDRTRSMSLASDPPSRQQQRKVTFHQGGSTLTSVSTPHDLAASTSGIVSSDADRRPTPRPRSQTNPRSLFRSRSMYSPKPDLADFEPRRIPASGSDPQGTGVETLTSRSRSRVAEPDRPADASPVPPTEPGAEAGPSTSSSQRFWKSPLRSLTIRSARRPRTSDGVVRESREDPHPQAPPAPTLARSRPPSPIPVLDSPIAVSASPIPIPTLITPAESETDITSTASELDPPPPHPRQPSVRRVTSTPRLSIIDEKQNRRRSMSLFQRAPPQASSSPSSPAFPSSSSQQPYPPQPRLASAPQQRSAPLLRKLSQSLLKPSSSSRPSLSNHSTPPSSYAPTQRSSEDLARQHQKQQQQANQAEVIRSLSAEFASSSDQKGGPEAYVRRMMHAVNPAEVAGLLAGSKDAFQAKALKAYMAHFDFAGVPLDVALRRLLMEAKLPVETQQIDRIIGAFAGRYEECNKGLFSAPDTAYILSYSLVLLHSDAFNKANKVKMSKEAYVKNTRLPGLLPCVLEYFYDNITAQPFKRANEHPEDIESDPSSDPFLSVRNGDRRLASSSALRPRKPDIYQLIASNTLHFLRIDATPRISPSSPFIATFTLGFHDILAMFDHGMEARYKAPVRRKSSFLIGAGPLPDEVHTHEFFRIIKAGIVKRREDLLLGNLRTTNRKPRTLVMILTSAQLLCYRNPAIVSLIQQHAVSPNARYPLELSVEPDEVVSLQNAFTVREVGFDDSTIRFVSPSKHQYLIEVDDAREAGVWVSLLNYASAFRTSGLQMRTSRVMNGLSLDDFSSDGAPPDGDVSWEDQKEELDPPFLDRPRLSSSSRHHPRSSITHAKLQNLLTHEERAYKSLESEMRQVRNLALLTPLSKATRDRIEVEFDPLARRVKQLRLQIARLRCEYEVLRADLVAFEADLMRMEPLPEPPSDDPLAATSNVDEVGHLEVLPPDGPSGRPESSSGSYFSAVDSTDA